METNKSTNEDNNLAAVFENRSTLVKALRNILNLGTYLLVTKLSECYINKFPNPHWPMVLVSNYYHIKWSLNNCMRASVVPH